MSASIWTRCGARANVRRLSGRAWRVVEAQHVTSTRKLVDSLEEQRILEELIEGSKPPPPDEARERGLHFLLFTPFRYPPLRHGSRFATRTEPSLWYGSTRPRTCLAECAYYRLLFVEGTTAELGPVAVDPARFNVTGLGAEEGLELVERALVFLQVDRPLFEAYYRPALEADPQGAAEFNRRMREAFESGSGTQ